MSVFLNELTHIEDRFTTPKGYDMQQKSFVNEVLIAISIIVLFLCSGKREREKNPQLKSSYSRYTIQTNKNPPIKKFLRFFTFPSVEWLYLRKVLKLVQEK